MGVGPTPRHVHTPLTPSDTRFSVTPVFSWTPRSGRSSGAGKTHVRTRPGCARCSCWFPRTRCPPGSRRRSSHRPEVHRSHPREETRFKVSAAFDSSPSCLHQSRPQPWQCITYLAGGHSRCSSADHGVGDSALTPVLAALRGAEQGEAGLLQIARAG